MRELGGRAPMAANQWIANRITINVWVFVRPPEPTHEFARRIASGGLWRVIREGVATWV